MKTVQKKTCILLSLLFFFSAPCFPQSKGKELFSINANKKSEVIARMLGDKYITSSPQVYFPKAQEATVYPWHYTTGVALWSLCQLSDVTGDPKYLDFVQKNFDYYMTNNIVDYSTMDLGGSMGHALLELNKRRPDEKYRDLVIAISDFFAYKQARLLDGSLCYYLEPERRRTWVDALFMVCPLLAKSTEIKDESVRYDDVFRQFSNYTVRLQDPEIKLFYQGWGWGVNRTTHAPGFWSRANGWVAVAMVEILQTIPKTHPQWKTLLTVYQDFAKSILKEQDTSGRWHQLLTHHDSFEETSGTSMFVYSFIHGYRNGWLGEEYRDSALRGFEALKEKIDKDGNIYGTCIGTGTQNTLEDYYIRETPINDSHGIGPMILAACAVSSLGKCH